MLVRIINEDFPNNFPFEEILKFVQSEFVSNDFNRIYGSLFVIMALVDHYKYESLTGTEARKDLTKITNVFVPNVMILLRNLSRENIELKKNSDQNLANLMQKKHNYGSRCFKNYS